jgi:effector-binding domain-containing protein
MADNDVEIETLEARPIVSIRTTIPVEQLGPAMGERIQTLHGYLRQSGTLPAGRPFVRYHTFGDVETDFEFGVPVVEPAGSAGSVVAGVLPGGPAVTTWHEGDHERLGEAYARIQAWLAENDRQAAGPGWEVYHWIDLTADPDTASSADPATWRVQLVQPIA